MPEQHDKSKNGNVRNVGISTFLFFGDKGFVYRSDIRKRKNAAAGVCGRGRGRVENGYAEMLRSGYAEMPRSGGAEGR